MKASHLAWTFLLLLFLSTAVSQQSTPSITSTPTDSTSLQSVNNGKITTRDGMTYKGVNVEKIDPDGVIISYTPTGGGVGMAKLKFEDLPYNLQQKYGYNPKEASAFETEQWRAIGQWRAQFIATDEEARAKRQSEQLADAVNDAAAAGTGFLITDDGFLLSCLHVVANANRIMVNTKEGLFHAELVKSDPVNDIALLKVDGLFHSLPLTSSDEVKLGQSVFTIGFPLIRLQGVEPKLTKGEISSLNGLQDNPIEFQISAAVQPGNSGGPLVNEYGDVVGIVAARLSDQAAFNTSGMIPQNVNYAIKSSYAKTLLESIPELSGKLKPPHLKQERKFEDVVQEAQDAVALVLVY
ncbi:MAG: serine protease [Verrucomicrobiota bacterium]|jgi:S1-C subfamily serine protease